MNDSPETNRTSDFAAAEAFALLGDETRVAILEALAGRSDDPRSFAQLREAVGVEDSGRFNYHLGKLVGRFVEKSDDGYRLTFAGSRVVGAVYEGTYAEGDAIEPIAMDADCPECGGGLALTYADERVRMGCTDCDEVVSEFGFPPGAIAGREPETLPAVLTSHMTTLVEQLRAGLCTNCSGPIEPTFKPETEEEQLVLEFACERCQTSATTSLASVLLTEPAVIAFHYDHGVDVRRALPWTLSWLVESEAEQVSESPPRYAVTGTLDGERLRVEVAETLDVLETHRGDAVAAESGRERPTTRNP